MTTVARMLIDYARTLRAANVAAHDLLDEGQFLALVEGRVQAAEPFRDGFRALMGDANDEGSRTLFTAEDGSRLLVSARRIGGLDGVLISARPDSPEPPLQPSVLEQMYGLTSVEAQVALALASGLELEQIAVNRTVSVGTLRAQLRGIYSKVGVDRQAQLVTAIWRLASI